MQIGFTGSMLGVAALVGFVAGVASRLPDMGALGWALGVLLGV